MDILKDIQEDAKYNLYIYNLNTIDSECSISV